ncbi:hypothetical protein [Amycolatopsis sp. WAC 04182]|uniref:hypothetical protein n=1 Tax=Amycolatopsis sp. WAC 04182 TaxID=2203198 RepID=UPI000F7949E8|nr:hypothetical protein [Amycolatopsis sp. WAC 04182]
MKVADSLMFNFPFSAISLWLLGFMYFSQHAYERLSESMPWQWFQGHTKGRAIVLSVAIGIGWPAVVILKQFEGVPFVMKAADFVTRPSFKRSQGNGDATGK